MTLCSVPKAALVTNTTHLTVYKLISGHTKMVHRFGEKLMDRMTIPASEAAYTMRWIQFGIFSEQPTDFMPMVRVE